MKCGTHAKVFSLNLVHGNSKNKISKDTEEECKKQRVNMEGSNTVGMKTEVPLGSLLLEHTFPQG